VTQRSSAGLFSGAPPDDPELQRPGARDATMATATLPPGQMQGRAKGPATSQPRPVAWVHVGERNARHNGAEQYGRVRRPPIVMPRWGMNIQCAKTQGGARASLALGWLVQGLRPKGRIFPAQRPSAREAKGGAPAGERLTASAPEPVVGRPGSFQTALTMNFRKAPGPALRRSERRLRAVVAAARHAPVEPGTP
jgi:hypothetical protein